MSSADSETFLNSHGFTRSVAGNDDFEAALRAVETIKEKQLGLIVSGEYGVGKTTLAKAVCAMIGSFFTVRLAIHSELEKLDASWQEYFMENPFARNVFLDDLGAEPPTNEYGVRMEKTADFIVEYHERHAAGKRLIITTNLSTSELDTRYGGRVLSRLKDLCVPLRLKGHDKRKWNI